MMLKIGLAQISPLLGDVPSNLRVHLAAAAEAAAQGVDLLVFPELSLTGYDLREQAFSVAISPTPQDTTFAALLEISKQLDMVFGFVEKDERHRYYISAAYLSAGKVMHIHRKVYLPTYGMFDEGRYFARGDAFRSFNTGFGRVGLLICEDFWHMSSPYLLWLDGADILILISATPDSANESERINGSARRVANLVQFYAGMLTNFVVHVNRTGTENGATFFGGSTIFDPLGNQIVQSTYYKEGLFTAELDLNQLRRARIRLPLLRDERSDLAARELRRILESR